MLKPILQYIYLRLQYMQFAAHLPFRVIIKGPPESPAQVSALSLLAHTKLALSTLFLFSRWQAASETGVTVPFVLKMDENYCWIT